ncbi:hypothetical protein [Haloferula rosea]|uniref:Uncharacterized protein n=1 Tax=Haloferula rosea TaxID=490093 RepID=A0A934RDI9_9BACT|nr:hypothetical protein [Haloferula rosea]MBK1827592.1 hypothetical protein [Haloferula rosea]
MSKEKGIFEPQEGFASPPKSPFAVDESAKNPFAAPAEAPKSPFAVAGDDEEATRLKPEAESSSPFASGQGKSPFGFEPPAASTSPFGVDESPKSAEPASSPFGGSPEPAKKEDSPFGQAPEKVEPAPAVEPVTPAPASPAPSSSSIDMTESDSSTIKQLELRAIFGVDRELSESEILQRAGALPGIRQLGRVSAADIGAVEGIKRVLGGLGFGGGQVKLYCGSAPIDFIREGSVMLAVQTDGGFAPGVRETLMIAAREIGRM